MDEDEWRELNVRHWDELVPIHLQGAFHDVSGFLAGGSTLRPFERAELGPVAGLKLVHAQCHFGLDTLSWAREGAAVTGFDFSAAAVREARDLAQRARLTAEFLEADVYDAIDALGGRTFDVVYTGIGAIHWLPDITRWAEVMARLLAPGGRFYMAEFHPFASVFADDELIAVDSYFDPGPHIHTSAGSYADPTAQTTQNTRVTWNHVLGDVVTSLAEAGLVIELLREHPVALRACWPFLERSVDGTYRAPSGRPDLPLLYSVRARRPSS
ncbi:MAG TPA: class I SAM-dependent methyltransferase [Solirubrobacteraceae bacterium]|nr:class I SAM-dependent methyltransferase [Solirubrobacteraceae bacterium]